MAQTDSNYDTSTTSPGSGDQYPIDTNREKMTPRKPLVEKQIRGAYRGSANSSNNIYGSKPLFVINTSETHGAASVLPGEYSLVDKSGMGEGYTKPRESRDNVYPEKPPYSKPSSASPKRLIPMAKPRSVPKLYDQARQKEKMRGQPLMYGGRKYKTVSGGIGEYGQPAGVSSRRDEYERAMRNKMAELREHSHMSRGGSVPGGRPDQNMDRAMYERELAERERRQAMMSRAARRKATPQNLLSTSAALRNFVEQEVSNFGEMCTRMEKRARIEYEYEQMAAEERYHQGGGHMRHPQMDRQQHEGYGAGYGAEQMNGYGPGGAPMGGPDYGHYPAPRREEVPPAHMEVPGNPDGGAWIPPATKHTILPVVELAVHDVDDRMLVAKEVEHCKRNTRAMMQCAKEILILAESDFSFSSALVDYCPPKSHMVATSFESEEKLQDFHGEKFEENLKVLREHNATVLHDVDCTDLESTIEASINKKTPEEAGLIKSRWSGHFDLVWLQLPHTGGTAKTNSSMIQRFLNTVGRVLKPNGLVFTTLYGMQVDHWKVSEHAQMAQMAPVLKIPFNTSVYPAIWTRYNPKVGFSNGFFDILRHPCDTFVFAQNEFTCVSKLKAVDTRILTGLRTVKINTITDLAEADKRLLSNDVDPKFIQLIRQAKAWIIVWSQLPDIIQEINPMVQQGQEGGHHSQGTTGHTSPRHGMNPHHHRGLHDDPYAREDPAMMHQGPGYHGMDGAHYYPQQ